MFLKIGVGSPSLGSDPKRVSKQIAAALWEGIYHTFPELDLDTLTKPHVPLTPDLILWLDTLENRDLSESQYKKLSIYTRKVQGLGGPFLTLGKLFKVTLQKEESQAYFDNTKITLTYSPSSQSRVVTAKPLLEDTYSVLELSVPQILVLFSRKGGRYISLEREIQALLQHELTHVIDISYNASEVIRLNKSKDYLDRPTEHRAWVETAVFEMTRPYSSGVRKVPTPYTYRAFQKDWSRYTTTNTRNLVFLMSKADKKDFLTRLYKRLQEEFLLLQ